VTTEEKQMLKLGLDVLQGIRVQLEDFQTTFDLLVHMTEKHQKEVLDLLKALQGPAGGDPAHK
jgi:hypothetical protein